SGLGIPLVAVGLFYDQGYFRQRLDMEGYQVEEYQDTRVEDLPMEPALDRQGQPITVQIDTRNGSLLAKVWLMRVGRVDLYLLDCDVEGNQPEDRELTSRLYGGDHRTRIRQELVLGIGGVRALHALGIKPGALHLNEGHSAFAGLEMIRELMEAQDWDFDEALREVAHQTVFTTHTPVPAGHDRFDSGMIEEHLGPLRDKLGLSAEDLMGLGRVEPHNHSENFCMTVLALKLSRRANAVSALHGHISRRMWAPLYPWRVEEEIPIGHITNGVHIPTWLAHQMRQLYDRHFPAGWIRRMGEPEVWQRIYDVDPGELWETHHALKNLLLTFVRRRVSRQCRRRGESDEIVEAARNVLDPNVLTIGFARRFATYKRADLLFWDVDRICHLLQDEQRPVQLIFAGKAHPADEPGKELIRTIANMRHDPRSANRVVFVEDYDMNVTRHMVQGVDVWLNNPRRPLEASGTSGQKAVLNGALNFSVLDGWWAEAYDGTNGFAIGEGRSHKSQEITDQRDAENLLRVLEEEVIPTYYKRDMDGLPRKWIKMMMNSIGSLAWRFSAHRMVMDYCRTGYVPAAGGLSCDMQS
ncbi:MAG: alpha-glucan family phosphorylase, partial [Planctomycetales bacterium]|nr:alpha-glucan family phosphorylase [Planctomycetales bacterium]NIP68116.1 alpha-glucan family phosphorylase [Planctomycetales bacterium]